MLARTYVDVKKSNDRFRNTIISHGSSFILTPLPGIYAGLVLVEELILHCYLSTRIHHFSKQIKIIHPRPEQLKQF